jgi:putative DNA primase/helicase
MSQNVRTKASTLEQRSRPKRPVLRPAKIPPELQQLRRWVCWSYTWSPGKKKWDKPPRQVDGAFASSTDPGTWCDFATAARALAERDRFDGIGLALVGDGLTAIDLDCCVAGDCRDAVREGDLAGIEAWVRAIVTELDSYTELSPSSCGIRILVRATLPVGFGNRNGGFEAYDRARYVTVTGDHIATTPRGIEQRQDALERVVARILPPAAVTPAPCATSEVAPSDDDELLERARGARNGFRFEALFDRGELADFDDDHSRADLALCSMLAFWCGRDCGRVDRLFRRSALYRKKWDERHARSGETYGQMTIAKALLRGRLVRP